VLDKEIDSRKSDPDIRRALRFSLPGIVVEKSEQKSGWDYRRIHDSISGLDAAAWKRMASPV
jgi:hypothetical protein